MKVRVLMVALAAAMVLPLAFTNGAGADESAEFKALCPVSGGPAKESNFVMYKTKKLYFCCPGCPKKFEADPAKFMAQVNSQLFATRQAVQVGCPVSGKPVNPDATVAFGEENVGFCCNGCKGKYEKASDEEKLAMLFGASSKGFTLQTACPVSGKPIKATAVAEHEGQNVYFCCDGCPTAFKKDPAKFVAKLPQFAK